MLRSESDSATRLPTLLHHLLFLLGSLIVLLLLHHLLFLLGSLIVLLSAAMSVHEISEMSEILTEVNETKETSDTIGITEIKIDIASVTQIVSRRLGGGSAQVRKSVLSLQFRSSKNLNKITSSPNNHSTSLSSTNNTTLTTRSCSNSTNRISRATAASSSQERMEVACPILPLLSLPTEISLLINSSLRILEMWVLQ
jgi:hypothetical protein